MSERRAAYRNLLRAMRGSTDAEFSATISRYNRSVILFSPSRRRVLVILVLLLWGIAILMTVSTLQRRRVVVPPHVSQPCYYINGIIVCRPF